MFKVIIAKDQLGKTVMVLRPGEGLVGGPDVRLRVALETASRAEAVWAAELIEQRLQAEGRRVSEPVRDGSNGKHRTSRSARPGGANASTHEGLLRRRARPRQ